MKFSTLNPRERRIVLGGAAILVIGLGWVYAVRPIGASLSDLTEKVAVEREALAREQAAVDEATRSPARKRVADSAMAATQSRLFSGANDVAAGAALATYLGDVARRSHVWLANAATRPAPTVRAGVAAPTEADGLHRLRVEVRAESDFRGVLDFLNNLERGDKVVTIERLDVAKTLRAGDEDRETLSITATVVGYALPRSALPPADLPAPEKAPASATARVRTDSAGGAP